MSRNCHLVSVPLYDYLEKRLISSGPQKLNLQAVATLINTVIRKAPVPARLAEVIYALIMHHEMRQGGMFRSIALGGTIMGKTSGVTYELTNLPPDLQQMLAIFINEISTDTCPFQVGS